MVGRADRGRVAVFPGASMGPRLDNRGWAPGPSTTSAKEEEASMGPRLDNRGWGPALGPRGVER